MSDLCSARSGSALLLTLSSCYTFSCSQHSRRSGFLSHYKNCWSLPSSGSFMLFLFSVYSCLGSFSFFRPQQDFQSLRVVFPDSCLKLLPDPFALCFLPFFHWFSKVWSGGPWRSSWSFQEGPQSKTRSTAVVRCIVFAFSFHLHSFMIESWNFLEAIWQVIL